MPIPCTLEVIFKKRLAFIRSISAGGMNFINGKRSLVRPLILIIGVNTNGKNKQGSNNKAVQ